jgi:hypothetical protein
MEKKRPECVVSNEVGLKLLVAGEPVKINIRYSAHYASRKLVDSCCDMVASYILTPKP